MLNDFLQELQNILPSERIYTDELRTLGWGTDASFYRVAMARRKSQRLSSCARSISYHLLSVRQVHRFRDRAVPIRYSS